MTIQQKAQKYIDQFEVIKIQDTDKTRVILKSDKNGLYDSESKLYTAIREAHGDRFPDDFVYSTFLSILEKITEYDTDSIDPLDEYRHEIVDSMVDIYTHDLTGWLHDDIYNVSYLDEAIENGATDGCSLLSIAQYLAIDEVYPFVQELLN